MNPLEQLSTGDLEKLSKNNLQGMSNAGLEIISKMEGDLSPQPKRTGKTSFIPEYQSVEQEIAQRKPVASTLGAKDLMRFAQSTPFAGTPAFPLMNIGAGQKLLQTPYERLQAFVANPVMKAQEGVFSPGQLMSESGKGLTGERLGQLGDEWARLGVPRWAANFMGMVETIGLSMGAQKGLTRLSKSLPRIMTGNWTKQQAVDTKKAVEAINQDVSKMYTKAYGKEVNNTVDKQRVTTLVQQTPKSLRKKFFEKATFKEITKRDVSVIKKSDGIVDVAKTQSNLPQVKRGYVRLYRAEGGRFNAQDVWNKKDWKLPKGYVEGNSEFYTPDLKYADYYRTTYGGGAKIKYIDVPQNIISKTNNPLEVVVKKSDLKSVLDKDYTVKELQETMKKINTEIGQWKADPKFNPKRLQDLKQNVKKLVLDSVKPETKAKVLQIDPIYEETQNKGKAILRMVWNEKTKTYKSKPMASLFKDKERIAEQDVFRDLAMRSPKLAQVVKNMDKYKARELFKKRTERLAPWIAGGMLGGAGASKLLRLSK